jgi:hypothetical protein
MIYKRRRLKLASLFARKAMKIETSPRVISLLHIVSHESPTCNRKIAVCCTKSGFQDDWLPLEKGNPA